MIRDFILFCWTGIIGVACWFFGDLDGGLKVLLALSIIDYFSGLGVGWVEHNLSSSTGMKGILKKIFMLSLVGMANLIDQYIIIEHPFMKYGVSLFFISNEGISILENAHKLGVPIPRILTDHFLDLKNKRVKTTKREAGQH